MVRPPLAYPAGMPRWRFLNPVKNTASEMWSGSQAPTIKRRSLQRLLVTYLWRENLHACREVFPSARDHPKQYLSRWRAACCEHRSAHPDQSPQSEVDPEAKHARQRDLVTPCESRGARREAPVCHQRIGAGSGITNLILPPSSDPPARPSRAIDSIVGQFCRKNAVASCMLGACTLTLHACLTPPFEIWKWKV